MTSTAGIFSWDCASAAASAEWISACDVTVDDDDDVITLSSCSCLFSFTVEKRRVVVAVDNDDDDRDADTEPTTLRDVNMAFFCLFSFGVVWG